MKIIFPTFHPHPPGNSQSYPLLLKPSSLAFISFINPFSFPGAISLTAPILSTSLWSHPSCRSFQLVSLTFVSVCLFTCLPHYLPSTYFYSRLFLRGSDRFHNSYHICQVDSVKCPTFILISPSQDSILRPLAPKSSTRRTVQARQR